MKWENLTLLDSYKKLQDAAVVDVKAAMAGENGAKRVKEYCVPMSNGMVYNFAAKQVDDDILAILQEFADEAELTEKLTEYMSQDIKDMKMLAKFMSNAANKEKIDRLLNGEIDEIKIIDGVNA